MYLSEVQLCPCHPTLSLWPENKLQRLHSTSRPSGICHHPNLLPWASPTLQPRGGSCWFPDRPRFPLCLTPDDTSSFNEFLPPLPFPQFFTSKSFASFKFYFKCHFYTQPSLLSSTRTKLCLKSNHILSIPFFSSSEQIFIELLQCKGIYRFWGH